MMTMMIMDEEDDDDDNHKKKNRNTAKSDEVACEVARALNEHLPQLGCVPARRPRGR
mgnify:CR=1 FL=1